jgi:hypothetical protein
LPGLSRNFGVRSANGTRRAYTAAYTDLIWGASLVTSTCRATAASSVGRSAGPESRASGTPGCGRRSGRGIERVGARTHRPKVLVAVEVGVAERVPVWASAAGLRKRPGFQVSRATSAECHAAERDRLGFRPNPASGRREVVGRGRLGRSRACSTCNIAAVRPTPEPESALRSRWKRCRCGPIQLVRSEMARTRAWSRRSATPGGAVRPGTAHRPRHHFLCAAQQSEYPSRDPLPASADDRHQRPPTSLQVAAPLRQGAGVSGSAVPRPGHNRPV